MALLTQCVLMQAYGAAGAASGERTSMPLRLQRQRLGCLLLQRRLQRSRRAPLARARRGHGDPGESHSTGAARQHCAMASSVAGLQLLVVGSASAAGLFSRWVDVNLYCTHPIVHAMGVTICTCTLSFMLVTATAASHRTWHGSQDHVNAAVHAQRCSDNQRPTRSLLILYRY